MNMYTLFMIRLALNSLVRSIKDTKYKSSAEGSLSLKLSVRVFTRLTAGIPVFFREFCRILTWSR